VSLYTSYSLSHIPRAGEQLASLATLTVTQRALEPEKFTNKEIGAKWDANSNLSLSASVYELTRNNVAVSNQAVLGTYILLDGQRTKGVELGVSGNITKSWSVLGGYAYQDGKVISNSGTASQEGAQVNARLANLPKNTFSLWNRYDFSPALGFGLGVIKQTNYLAANENKAQPATNVTVPGFTRVDGAVFYRVNKSVRLQLNVENLFDKEYFQFAHSNTNITPGAPRTARVTMIASF
jgi:catecholate siderophore receptor